MSEAIHCARHIELSRYHLVCLPPATTNMDTNRPEYDWSGLNKMGVV